MKSKLFFFILIILLIIPAPTESHAAMDDITVRDVVVVIDPGHGGENMGEENTEMFEKERNLITAQAMAAELSKYEGIQVYLTRNDDVDMSLKERAEFAAGVKADLLISVHYNASVDHEVFGAEIWIPSAPPFHGVGYGFGRCWTEQMGKMGLHLRGIKTRLGNKGDYYGIIREAAALGMPAVILEHCHVDVESDSVYADTEEKMQAFGREDAQAVARYFGLKNSVTGEDHGSEKVTPADGVMMYPLNDSTEPDECILNIVSKNEETGEVTFRIDAADNDEALEYFDYSTDGGESYTGLSVWPDYSVDKNENEKSASFTIMLPREKDSTVTARVYNRYDLKTESEAVNIHFLYQDELKKAEEADEEQRKKAALAWEAEHDGGEAAYIGFPAEEDEHVDITAVYPVNTEEEMPQNPAPDRGWVILCMVAAAAVAVLVPVMLILLIARTRFRRRQTKLAKALEVSAETPKSNVRHGKKKEYSEI